MFFILIFLCAVLLAYLLVIRTWSFFSDRNVPFERGLPGLGTLSAPFYARKVMADEIMRIYNKYPNERYVGMYEMGGKPSVMIRDPELVKAISIKDFDSFINHALHIDEEIDPLISRGVFATRDQKWRDMRSVLSPLFTGSKMRMMLSLMADSIAEFTSFIRREINEKNPKGGVLEFNMFDLLTAATNDVIASCVFGIHLNTLKDRENEFYTAGKSIAYALQGGKMLLAGALPGFTKFIRMKIISPKYDDFFRNIVRNNIQQRKEQNIVRNDLIHLMVLAQQGKLDLKEKEDLCDAGFATISEEISVRSAEKLKDLTEDDFVAQCLIFFVAGFTGVATTMCFACHELALHRDIQKRLQKEIDETNKLLGGQNVTYETLQRMKYLDQVISEVLRLWPVGLLIDRCVSKQYLLENSDGLKMLLQPNDIVWLPLFAIHRDPKYYPNPDRFDPERFSAENRKSINPATYFPFGVGPRACVASRFALMELKAAVYYLLRDFDVECSGKTDAHLKLKPGSFSLEPANGFWLQLKLRNKS